MQIISHFRKSMGLLAGIGLALSFGTAQGNGWEHTTIPLSALVAALDDPASTIRQRAAESLGHRHEKAAVEALLDRTNADETDPRVRQTVYRALGKLGDGAATGAVLGCAKSERNAAVRGECVSALGSLRTDAADRFLIEMIDSVEPVLQRRAINALGMSGSQAAIGALQNLLDADAPALRIAAIAALGATRQPAAASALIPLLEPDGQPAQVLSALQALSNIDAPAAAAPATAVWERAKDPALKRAALLVMARDQDNAGSAALAALESEDWLLRYQALEILLGMGAQEQGNPAIYRALVTAGDAQTRAVLARDFAGDDRVRDTDTLKRSRAELDLLHAYLRTIIALDPRYGFALFRRAGMPTKVDRDGAMQLDLAIGLYRARWQAIYGIGYTFNPGAKPVLEEALADPDFRIRAVGLRSVGVYGAKKFRSEVLGALGDPMAEVRWTAARVVGRDPVFTDPAPLIALLEDTHAKVREEAALSIGYGLFSEGADALRRTASSDREHAVREAARYALGLLAAD